MAIFNVTYKITVNHTMEVEADNLQKALEQAEYQIADETILLFDKKFDAIVCKIEKEE